ncbi:hypothetical protein Prudu_834S000200, partial [Prunus dulcis]
SQWHNRKYFEVASIKPSSSLSLRENGQPPSRDCWPPPSTNGRGTGGLEPPSSPLPFPTDLHPWAARSWSESHDFRRMFTRVSPIFQLDFLLHFFTNQSSKAPEVQSTAGETFRRVQLARTTRETLSNFQQKSKGKFKKN